MKDIKLIDFNDGEKILRKNTRLIYIYNSTWYLVKFTNQIISHKIIIIVYIRFYNNLAIFFIKNLSRDLVRNTFANIKLLSFN